MIHEVIFQILILLGISTGYFMLYFGNINQAFYNIGIMIVILLYITVEILKYNYSGKE